MLRALTRPRITAVADISMRWPTLIAPVMQPAAVALVQSHRERGDRIAQLVIQKVELVEWRVVDELDATDRGLGGFGSTGI